METLWANFPYCAQDTPSQMGCVIRQFTRIQRQLYFQDLRWRTLAYRAHSCLISNKRFPNSVEIGFVREEKLSSPSHFSCDAISHFLGFVLKILGVVEAQYLFAASFIFSELFRSGSGF